MKTPVHRCLNGDDALDYLYQRGAWSQQSSRPSLVFLDLNMPGTDGRTVLATIKADAQLKAIPVLILTASLRQDDVDASYCAGANSYFIKPDSLKELAKLVDVINRYWLGDYLARHGCAVTLAYPGLQINELQWWTTALRSRRHFGPSQPHHRRLALDLGENKTHLHGQLASLRDVHVE